MAARQSSYYWQQVMDTIRRSIPAAAEADMAALMCNRALVTLWTRWDWRETIAPMAPFWLTPGTQDYGAPANVIPTDFSGLRQAYLITLQGNLNNSPLRAELEIIKDIRKTYVGNYPSAIGYVPDQKAFRVFPCVPTNIGAPNFLIGDITYKKLPPKLTAANLATTLIPWDDIYYDVVLETARWAGMSLSGMPQAGAVNDQGGRKAYSGQLAVAMSMMDAMAANEGLELGDPVITPESPLVPYSTSGGGYGSFLGLGIGY